MASIERRGDVWRVRVRVRGQLLTKTLDSEAEANAWATAEEARLRAGVPAAEILKLPTRVGVAALFDRYAREVSPEKKGARWEAIRLRKLAPGFPMAAVDLDGAALAEWRDRRLKEVSASSVNRELGLISSVFTHAIKEWRLPVPVNPCLSIKWPRKPHARKRRVPDKERDAVILALGWDGTRQPVEIKEWIAWGFALALETMMRQGEILKLVWKHVHVEKKKCHLPKTKNGHARDVPLSSKAVALFALLDVGGPDNAVVPVEAGTFGNYFRRAVKAAKIVDLHFHDTRREAATRISKKLSQIELMRAIGHTDARSLNVYYQPDATEMAEKMDD